MVARVKIPKGTVLTADMLTVKVAEPMGVKAEDIFELVGKTVMENVEEDESIVSEVVDSYGKKAKCWQWLDTGGLPRGCALCYNYHWNVWANLQCNKFSYTTKSNGLCLESHW